MEARGELGRRMWLTLRVSKVDRRGSGWRRSVGRLTLSVEMALSRVRGTGSTCISALPSLLSGIGLPPAPYAPHAITACQLPSTCVSVHINLLVCSRHHVFISENAFVSKYLGVTVAI